MLTRRAFMAAASAASLSACAAKPPEAAPPPPPPPMPAHYGAIYTEHVAALHLVRMVIVRVGSITDYLVLKLH